jgi:hypothetical protein
MSDTLDQDVQALKEWLSQAWRYVAQPSLTRFQRQEMRNQMRLADAKLRAGLEKIASRDKLIVMGNGDADHAGTQVSEGLKGAAPAITPNGSQ